MSQELKHTTPELEEIADIPEPVIDLTEEDLIIDIPEEEKVTGQLEEITGLQEVIPSTIIVEDENPPLHIQKDYHDDILDITARVDAVNTIKVIEDSAHDKLHKEKEERIFEGIPEPLKSHKSNDKIQIKESYIDSAKDEENKEIKGKIYFDKNIDALVIEDISEDEELASEEQHEKEFALSNDELKADGIKHDDVFVDKEIPSKAEFKIKKPDTDIITIEIPPEVRNKIEEKDIEDFQFINLDEAEQIASEDILILSEDDLIEELDEYDLIPVESAVDEKKSKDRKKEKIEVHHNTKIVQPEKKANVTPPEPKLSEQITITPDKESKKAELKKIEDKKISKDEAITERKLDELKVVTEEIIEEVPKKETETSKEPPKKTQSSMTKTDNIEFIALEEEISKEPKVNATATIKEASGTEQLMKDYTRLKTETIPDDLARAITTNQKILIIDDTGVNVQQQLLTQENPIDEIDRLVSGMIEITEGDVKILQEASAKEEDEYIAPILTGTLPTFQDRMVEFEEEYKFKDDDIVFIDNAILVDEYDKYLKVIDEYYETKAVKKSSSTVELFGLTKDEFEFFYDILFEKEYETIQASKTFKDVTIGRDHPEKDAKLVKQFKYIQAKPQSLSEKEKKSIEEDIESPVAVVIEENIDDIVERLKKIKPHIDIKKLLAKIPQEQTKLVDQDSGKTATTEEKKVEIKEEITNITDQVIILDSKDDVNRFVDTLPIEKQENIKKLLKYLDSLFDKLPEDVIKNFANSEYFDLYVKVLNELGV